MDPDPDGPNTGLNIRAVQLTYRPDGQVSKKELGTITGSSSPSWSTFAASQAVDIGFDSNSRPVTSKLSGGGVDKALTQTSYDTLGRVDCTTVRMNPAVYGSLPAACSLGTQGSDGPDRVSQTMYDNASEPTQLKAAVGTSEAATERTLTYTTNGKLQTLTDGESNKTTYVYDGFDRLSQTQYPSPTTKNSSNAGDYEQLTYDANSNVTQRRTRSAATITFGYDNLNRVTSKTSASLPTVNTTYDLLDRMLTAAFTSGQGVTNTYDALGRLTSSTADPDGVSRTFNSTYDAAGDRLSLTGHAGYSAGFSYDLLGRMTAYLEGGTAPAVRLSYDDLGRRTRVAYGVGADSSTTTYGYDGVSRLNSLAHDLAGTANDLTQTFVYNPANQIASQTRSNDAYAFAGNANTNTGYTSNGLNQLTAAGAASLTYDANGNITSDGTSTYVYDDENRLTSVTKAGSTVTFSYDPLGRLWRVGAGGGTADRIFAWDGDQLIREYDGNGTTLRSYVHGPGIDEPLVVYRDSPPWDRWFVHADERGSVIALADNGGNSLGIDSYDEYGNPGAANQERFSYTGQIVVQPGLIYYKNRMYSPTLGRFLQTDPIGMEDDPNLYAYVGNDPVNNVDPMGLADLETIYVTRRINPNECTGGCSMGATLLLGVINGPQFFRDPSSRDGGPGRSATPVQPAKKAMPPKPKPDQCQPAPGDAGDYERNLSSVATFLEGGATIAVFTGAEPIAVTLEAGAGVLTYLKYRSQLGRGDVAGARITAATFGGSLLLGHALGFVKIGGSGQRHFNSGIGSALAAGYGHGVEKILNCE